MTAAPRGPERQLESMRRTAEMKRLQAEMGPMPTKMLFGPGIVPGRVADINAMNAYQRQLFLPQSSQMVSTPGQSPASLQGGWGSTGGANTGTAGLQQNALSPQQIAQMYPGMFERMYGGAEEEGGS